MTCHVICILSVFYDKLCTVLSVSLGLSSTVLSHSVSNDKSYTSTLPCLYPMISPTLCMYCVYPITDPKVSYVYHPLSSPTLSCLYPSCNKSFSVLCVSFRGNPGLSRSLIQLACRKNRGPVSHPYKREPQLSSLRYNISDSSIRRPFFLRNWF